MTSAIKTSTKIYARNVWTAGDRVQVRCHTDGTVLAWDSVAGHYVRADGMTDAKARSALARARRLAV